MDYEGSANIIKTKELTVDGIFRSVGQRISDLTSRVDVIEDQLDQVPTDTDFLKPEDVKQLFSGREVIFDV